jgi:hypothetical protein
MDFHEWMSWHEAARRKAKDLKKTCPPADVWYKQCRVDLERRSENWMIQSLLAVEAGWYDDHRPYYSVYPSMVEPDVLRRDLPKWERSHDPAIVARAIRNGKRGWLVGAKLEVIPHVRRPHMALRWTGPGGKVPRIVPVKGSIVHREIIEHLPTGRLDDEDKDDDAKSE